MKKLILLSVICLVAAFFPGSAAGQMMGGGGGHGPGFTDFHGYENLPLEHNLVLPQLAVGSDIDTTIVLLNLANQQMMTWVSPSDLKTTGKVRLFRSDGTALSVSVQGLGSVSEIPFSVDAGQVARFRLTASGAAQVGWALVDIDEAITDTTGSWGMMDGQPVMRGERISATVFYSVHQGSQLLSQVGVIPSLFERSRFFNSAVVANEDGQNRTGVAIVNTGGSSASVELRLKSNAGQTVATRTITLGAGNQTAQFIGELFGNSVPADFQGYLQVITQQEGVVTMGLLVTGNVLTSIPSQHFGGFSQSGMMSP